MNPDLNRAPFSRFGSYLTVVHHRENNPRRPRDIEPGLWLSGVHGFNSGRESFQLLLGDWHLVAHPSHLILRGTTGCADLCIAEPACLRLRCREGELRLRPSKGRYNYILPQRQHRWTVNSSRTFVLYTIDRLSGELREEDGDLVLGGGGELALRPHVGFADLPPVEGTFDEAVSAVDEAFEQFVAPYRAGAGDCTRTAEEAAWLNWSCVVGVQGHFRRPAMLMSKNWMTNVWSWDHAINALALGPHHPSLAWDQLMTIFDHQLPSGQLPDFINDAVRLYNYVKPPIHGWVLSQLLAANSWFAAPERLLEIYEPLGRWTEWWFRFRLPEGRGVPEYYHGNDSGWDNGTVFDAGTPVTSPDCAAFLILQMETLGNLATRLGKPREADAWQQRAADLLPFLLEHWDGRRFRVTSREGNVCTLSDSLFGCLPIILGMRLPADIRKVLLTEIRRHLTEWGLASEHPDSPLYESEGYWRGPIWAPPTLLIAEGVRAAGDTMLADDIARRFCRLCRQSGFAENFDAVSGAPLCDPAYTWTASTFLHLLKPPEN